MPSVHKIAGQAAPVADTNTDLYTVPGSTQFISSTLAFVNRDTEEAASIRIAVVPNGETLSNEHYLEYGALLDARESRRITIGMTLSAGDKVIVRSDTADTSFTLFGVEQS